MKLVSVARALKELQNESHFVQAVPYIVVKANANSESTGTGTLRYCEVNFTSYSARTKQLADKKFVAHFIMLYLLM